MALVRLDLRVRLLMADMLCLFMLCWRFAEQEEGLVHRLGGSEGQVNLIFGLNNRLD
jgi:hypothetical protein